MNSIQKQGKTVEQAVELALRELGVTREEVTIEVLEKESAGFFGIGSKDALVKLTVNNPVNLETSTEEIVDPDSYDDAEDDFETSDEYENDEEFDDFEDDEDDEDDDEYEYDDSDNDESDEEFDQKIQVAADAIEEFLNKVLQHFGLEDVNQVKVVKEESRIKAEIDGEDCGILIGRKGETLRSLQYISSLVANKTAKTRVRFVLDIGGYKSKRKNNVAALAKRTAERAVRTGQAFELTPMSAADRRIVHETLNDFPGVVTYSEGEEPRRYVVIDLEFDEDEVIYVEE